MSLLSLRMRPPKDACTQMEEKLQREAGAQHGAGLECEDVTTG